MAERQRFLIRFWGVRGSYPTPGPSTLRHGGNTACVEIQVGEHTLIFDAGSGIIRLGNELLRRTQHAPRLDIALFITHGHLDHLLGFPFFVPLFQPRTTLHLFGPQLAGRSIEELVTPMMSPPYFPVDIRLLPSQRVFHTIVGGQTITWHADRREPVMTTPHNVQRLSSVNGVRTDEKAVRVTTLFTQSHPLDGAVVYSVEYGGKRVVYATDVEWQNGCEPAFLHFIEGADLLIHDAQYTTPDYEQLKQGYGHCTVAMAVEAARAARVGELILFHHEPTYDDDQLDAMEAEARLQFSHTRSAYEGMEIDLLAKKAE